MTNRNTPAPDPFDLSRFSFGKEAGANKFNWTSCPTCRKPATHPNAAQFPWASQIPAMGFFMFRDELSATEYYISGMCQECQDKVFGTGDER